MSDYKPIENISSEDCKVLQGELLYPLLSEIIDFTPAFKSFQKHKPSLNQSTSIEILRKFPLLNKNQLITSKEEYIRSNIVGSTFQAKSGGTTGKPVVIERLRSEYVLEGEFVSVAWNRLGVKLGSDKGVVLSSRLPAKSEDSYSYIDKNRMLWLTCNKNSQDHWNRILNSVKQYQPKYIRGYGSLILEYFRQLERKESTMPTSIIGVAYSSDNLNPREIKFIKQNYCENLISLYGQTERVTMGVTCEKHNKFHLFPNYGFTELIREDGSVIEAPGEIGEVVGTSLFPRAMSLIRYRTGDMASWAEYLICECGRQVPTLENFFSRKKLLICKTGASTTLGRLDSYHRLINSLPIGTSIQFQQTKPGVLHAYIQTRIEDYSIFHDIINMLSNNFEMSFEFIENPILQPNGKRTLII